MQLLAVGHLTAAECSSGRRVDISAEVSTAADVAWSDCCLRAANGQDQTADSMTA